MPLNFRNRLIAQNKGFDKGCDLLDIEYDQVLKKTLDTKFDQNEKSGFLVKDLVRQELGADLITYGDYTMHKGNEVPTDTYLTPKLEFCSK